MDHDKGGQRWKPLSPKWKLIPVVGEEAKEEKTIFMLIWNSVQISLQECDSENISFLLWWALALSHGVPVCFPQK